MTSGPGAARFRADMAFEFKLPDIGEGVVEGEIVKWLVSAGDRVAEDQPLVEVMTDKATVVIPSPKAGTVLETRGAEGDIAKVHETLVVIEVAGGAAAPAPTPAPASVAAAPTPEAVAIASTPTVPAPAPRSVPPSVPPAAAPALSPGAAPDGKVLAAPATRRLARELGVPLTAVHGSGPSGRVTSADVRAAAEAPTTRPSAAPAMPSLPPLPPVPVAPVAELAEEVPVRGLRKRIWENMARSKQLAAHFTFVEECDCTGLVAARDRFNAQLEDGEDKLSYLPFILKAVIASLKRFPDLNGHVDEARQLFVRRRDFHIGVAVSTERGLIVPVVRHADRRSMIELSAEIKRVADAARAGRIGPEDLGGSTFTLTSLGKEGGIFATPVINHPEVAIMGVHKMVKRPMVDDDDQIVVKPMMNLSLSFDHRLVDGHVGAAFTYSVIRLLERPDRLMMEMV
jgi:pyruvate dehydrogenase E2 component (dihydrolipoamide acetyltransferase)